MVRKDAGRLVAAILVASLTAELAPAGAQVAGRTPNPAIAECSRLQGALINNLDARLLFYAPSGDFTVLLPGRDWCETFAPDQSYTFVWLRLLSQRRLSSPNASAEEVAMVQVQVQVQVQAMPLTLRVGQTIPTPEALRGGILALRRGERVQPGTEGVLNLLENAARDAGFDMAIVQSGARCLHLHSARSIAATPPPHRTPHRRIEAQVAYCLAHQGGAAAILTVISAVPAGDEMATSAAALIRERVLAPIHFEPWSNGVSPTCQSAQAFFQQIFPACAANVGVQAEPGAPGAVEVAMGCLSGALESSRLGRSLQRRCFAEVLRDAGFRDALPLDLLQRLRRAQGP